MRYEEYGASASRPNVVVDGSPNDGTVLCLSHWPGMDSPADLADDLSAQIAFRYVDAGMDRHGDAEIVTNNHFDQDGLAGVFALTSPDVAIRHRALIEDLAAAGDFGTYRDRRAARLSAVVSVWALGANANDPYPEALERLPHMIDHLDEYRELWQADDERLTASENAIEAGRVVVADEPDLDLAVVTVDPDLPATWGHRFGGRRFDGLHPMAVNNATDMSTLALVHGRRYSVTHRYETWVQYRSRTRRPRVALLPIARQLTEVDAVQWRADAVGDLTPTLSHAGESSLAAGDVLAAVREHLRTAPPAWDPAVGRTAGTASGG